MDFNKASAVECILSRRDSTIVARHEVPGIMRKNSPVPAGRLNRSWFRTIHYIRNQVEHHRRGLLSRSTEYLGFLKRHELRFDDKLSLELTMTSTVPPGRGLSASLPRHFVPGYYRGRPYGDCRTFHLAGDLLIEVNGRTLCRYRSTDPEVVAGGLERVGSKGHLGAADHRCD